MEQYGRKKEWWRSRTIWVNGVALIASISAVAVGVEINAGAQGAIITILNLLLRFDTDGPIR